MESKKQTPEEIQSLQQAFMASETERMKGPDFKTADEIIDGFQKERDFLDDCNDRRIEAELEKEKRERERKINVYTCKHGHHNVTIDRDSGTTPMTINCRVPGCTASAYSAWYKCDQNLTPTLEWYRPKRTRGLTPAERDHVNNGGVLLRAISEQPRREAKFKDQIKALRGKGKPAAEDRE